MSQITSRLLNIILPSTCCSCGDDITERSRLFPALCAVCRAKITWSNSFEPLPGTHVDALYALSPFEGPLRDLVHLFKYRGKERIGEDFADLWVRHTPFDPSEVGGVVAVPMSPWKEFHRGYNPAAVIARRIAKKWGVPCWTSDLSRRWIARSQTDLGRRERFLNADRGFMLNSRAKVLKGLSLLLVDDVCTTGATLSACARLLKEVGVRRILGGVAAREIS